MCKIWLLILWQQNMTKTETLRIRLSKEEMDAYYAVCEKQKVAPSTKAREMIVNFIQENLQASLDFHNQSLPKLVPGTLTVGEMFSGPGGIGLALTRAKYGNFKFRHVWATDYDPDTCRTYKSNVLKNEPNALVICEDVRKLDIEKLPVVDGFLYGFPCNDFSTVGESKGLNGNFGGLYSYGVRYIDRVNPLFFFAENVSGLGSANEGRAFKKILASLNHAGKYGYTITAHLYKFEQYGIPQARHRYILIGIRGDLNLTYAVPTPSGKVITCEQALRDIPLSATNQELTKQSTTVTKRLQYIREGENVWQAEQRIPEELRLKVKGARLSQIYRRLDSQRPAYTITGSGGGGTHVYHWKENRALTNRERARLQTFPDDFVFCGTKESVRKQIGMAVPCDGAQIILEALLKTLSGKSYPSVTPSIGVFKAKSYEVDKS